MNITTYAPRFAITVKDFATKTPKLQTITDDVLSVSTAKAYQRCTGSWSVTLTPRVINGKRYDELIQPSDILEIALDAGDGSGMITVMVGLVTRVAISFSAGSIQPMRTVRINGEDMGKLLMTEIGWDINPANMVSSTANGTDLSSYQDRQFIVTGTPASILQQIYDRVVIKGFAKLSDYITTSFSEQDDWTILQSSGYMVETNSIWNAMMLFENRPFNALYCDTQEDGTFVVGLEPYPILETGVPFRPSKKTLYVDDWQIVSEDLGTCDSERMNFITINTPMLTYYSNTFGMDISLISSDLVRFDRTSINQYGYCPHIIQTEFFPPEAKEQTQDMLNLSGQCKARRDLFWNWYSINHELEAGSITIHGTPQVRAGWILDHQKRNKRYLIEQVSHDFSVWPQPSFTTTLEVTRGR